VAGFCVPMRVCPSSPRPPSPTRGEGGVWASQTSALERGRRLLRHRSAYPAYPRASDRLTRRRGGAEIRVSVKGRPVACHPCSSVGYSSFSACGRDARAPFKFMGARASGAHISSVCSRCVPPARMRAGTPAHPGLNAIAPPGLPGAQRGLMVFSSPRRRALPWLAEGFSPTASTG